MMKFDILNRSTGAVQVTAKIDATEKTPRSIKLGLAVRWAVKAHANLAHANLRYAYLGGADLGGADLRHANLTDADLRGADLGGANLAHANLRYAYLGGADLRGADLGGADLRYAYLRGANLAHANLAGAYLRGADLGGADLAGADLGHANLTDADLRGAKNIVPGQLEAALQIPPEDIPVIPNIDAAILAEIEKGGILNMDDWHGPDKHWCGTTHCRAGWAIYIAGAKGKALEDWVGPQMAGTLIYHASRPGQPAPYFFATTNDALADIRKCAAEQQAKG